MTNKKLDELKQSTQTKEELVTDINKSIAEMSQIAKLILDAADKIKQEQQEIRNEDK